MTREHLRAIVRNWIFIAVALVIGGLIGGGIALSTPRSYNSSTAVYFSVADPTTVGSPVASCAIGSVSFARPKSRILT